MVSVSLVSAQSPKLRKTILLFCQKSSPTHLITYPTHHTHLIHGSCTHPSTRYMDFQVIHAFHLFNSNNNSTPPSKQAVSATTKVAASTNIDNEYTSSESEQGDEDDTVEL